MADYISKYESGAAVDAALDLAMSAVQPETGKGLSSNDYTTAEKEKLASISTDVINSGIDSTKVAQIATNTTNIANITTALNGISFWTGTQAEYDDLSEYINTIFYLIISTQLDKLYIGSSLIWEPST